MQVAKVNSLPSIYYRDKKILYSSIEDSLKDSVEDGIKNEENYLISYPNDKVFLSFVIQMVLKNEMNNFIFNKDPSRRTSVLIVTENTNLVDLLMGIYIKSEDVFQMSNYQHKFLMDNGIFCNIDDPFFAKLYWKHFLSIYFNEMIPDKIPLHYIFPVANGFHKLNQYSRGDMNKLGRKDNNQDSVFNITKNYKLLNFENYNFDFIFVDYSSTNKYYKNTIQGSMFFFDEILDERIRYINNKKSEVNNYIMGNEFLDFSSASQAMVESPFYKSKDEIDASKITNINLHYIKSDFEEKLEDSFSRLKALIYKKFDTYDLNLLKTLLYNIIQLPTEGVVYDNVASFDLYYDTIRDVLKELKQSDNRYEDEDFENLLINLEDIYIKFKLDSINPKFEYLLELIDKEKSKDATIGIIVSNKIHKIALKEKLSMHYGIEIENLSELGIDIYIKNKILKKHITNDKVILLSSIKVDDFNVFKRNKNATNHIILYKLEIIELRRKLKELMNISNKALDLHNNKDDLSSENIYSYLYNKLKIKALDRQTSKTNNSIEISTIFHSIEDDYNIPEKRLKNEYQGNNSVFAKLVILEDGSSIFIRENNQVRIIDKKKKNLSLKNSSEIRKGDELVLIDNDLRKDLFNVFIKSLDGRDKSVENYNKVEEWREIFEDKYISSNYDDDKLFKRLKEIGWNKTTKSILKNWRSGYSFGPRDFEDIVLLGKAMGINVFINSASDYHRAMNQIRVERRVAAKILNKIIHYTKNKINNEDLHFLSKYNFTVDDVKETIKIKRVTEVSERVYKVKPSEIGITYN